MVTRPLGAAELAPCPSGALDRPLATSNRHPAVAVPAHARGRILGLHAGVVGLGVLLLDELLDERQTLAHVLGKSQKASRLPRECRRKPCSSSTIWQT